MARASILLALIGITIACSDAVDQDTGQPEPPPSEPLPEDLRITWDPQSQMVQVPSTRGCDSWTPTWAADGHLYTAFGDCRPDGVPQKIGMGFGRLAGESAYAVEFTAVATGDPADWDDAAAGSGVEALGDSAASQKPAGMLQVDGRLWYWIRNVGLGGTGVRLKFSDGYAASVPAFTWVSWSVPEIGYASFVQYGQGYSGGPADYVYAVVPMTSDATGGMSNSAYNLVPAFGLMRGSRMDLTRQESWEFFCGTTASPAWCAASAAAKPIVVPPDARFTPRAGMSWNPGLGRFMLSLVYDVTPETPNEGTRFHGGLTVLLAPEPWGPWQTVFSSESATWPGGTSSAACDSTPWGSGERADIPTKYLSADGRTFYLFFSGGDCLSIARGVLH